MTKLPLPLGVLDLSPVPSSGDARQAIENTLDLARHVESLGYGRYWLAEHHNAGGLACSVPEVLVAAVASATRTLRVGSGGVMLPNHSALRVAEAFRMLEALHPQRIDLGLGRAPGTDKKTALALRRSEHLVSDDSFVMQLDELFHLLRSHPDRAIPFNPTKASPIGIAPPELWILGASEESARNAGERGVAYAYAHHFAPDGAREAIAAYRATFRRSTWRNVPRVLLATSVVCGATDAAAEDLASSGALFFLRAGQGLRDLPMPTVADAKAYPYDADERTLVAHHRRSVVVGGPERVAETLVRLASEATADELMITTMIEDHAERRRSYERIAAVITR